MGTDRKPESKPQTGTPQPNTWEKKGYTPAAQSPGPPPPGGAVAVTTPPPPRRD